MTQDIYINRKNARLTWGIITTETSLSELTTPPPLKDLVTNESRLEDGKRVIARNPKVKDRDVTLTLNFLASTEAEFWQHYLSFCEELKKGRLEVRTQYQQGVIYRLDYRDCTQFQQFRRRMAKYSLRCNEPDPTDRALTGKHPENAIL